MREKTTDDILKAFGDFNMSVLEDCIKFTTVCDSYAIPDDPRKLLENGQLQDIPIIVGNNANEGALFYVDMTRKEYINWLISSFGENIIEVYNMFPAKTDTEISTSFDKLITVTSFVAPQRHLCTMASNMGNNNIYFYRFGRVPPTKLAGQFGAYHSIEIGYVFGNLNEQDGYTKDDFKLSEQMMDYWVNFAKNDDPNEKNGTMLPYWPRYDTKTKQTSFLQL